MFALFNNRAPLMRNQERSLPVHTESRKTALIAKDYAAGLIYRWLVAVLGKENAVDCAGQERMTGSRVFPSQTLTDHLYESHVPRTKEKEQGRSALYHTRKKRDQRDISRASTKKQKEMKFRQSSAPRS